MIDINRVRERLYNNNKQIIMTCHLDVYMLADRSLSGMIMQ